MSSDIAMGFAVSRRDTVSHYAIRVCRAGASRYDGDGAVAGLCRPRATDFGCFANAVGLCRARSSRGN